MAPLLKKKAAGNQKKAWEDGAKAINKGNSYGQRVGARRDPKEKAEQEGRKIERADGFIK